MRDQHDRAAGLHPDVLKLHVHQVARHGVERAERFVHQEDFGLAAQRPRYRSALPHAARQLPRPFGLEAGDADELSEVADPLSTRARADAAQFQRKGDILLNGEPWKQIGVLKHHTEIFHGLVVAPLARPEIASRDADIAGGRRDEAGHQTQHRGLAAAGGTDQHHELAARHVDVGRRQCDDALLVLAVTLADASKFDCRRGLRFHHARWRR